jgi:hypothetical protein
LPVTLILLTAVLSLAALTLTALALPSVALTCFPAVLLMTVLRVLAVLLAVLAVRFVVLRTHAVSLPLDDASTSRVLQCHESNYYAARALNRWRTHDARLDARALDSHWSRGAAGARKGLAAPSGACCARGPEREHFVEAMSGAA